MTNHFAHFVLTGYLLLLAGIGTTAPSTEQEIRHLLDYIAGSDCTFIRNDTTYTATEAHKHISHKYDRLKSRIDSAESFILLAATQSSVSGKPYHIRCGDKESPSKDWLINELKQYRHIHSELQ